MKGSVFVIGGLALLAFVVVKMGQPELATVEYTACQDVPAGHQVHAPGKSLFVRSSGQPITKGFVYELTYVVGKGEITQARQLRPASCQG